MFALGIDYNTGILIHAYLAAGILGMYTLHCFYIAGYNFVNDYNLYNENSKDYMFNGFWLLY